MQIGRKYLQGHGRELPKTVGRTSLFVKHIFEKSGQGETYELDPASLVYLRPVETVEEEKKTAPEEERAREYVLREKETMKLITKEEKVREFYTNIIRESVLPSAQEMLREKSWRKQLSVQLEILLKECREVEHRTEHFAGQQEIGQIWHNFRNELHVLEQQAENWNNAGSREESHLQKQIKETVEQLFTCRTILENQERQQQQKKRQEAKYEFQGTEAVQKIQHLFLELTEEERAELRQEILKQERTYQQNVSEFVKRYETEAETETVHAETILDQIRILCLEELFGKEVKKENSDTEKNRPILLEEELPEPEMTYKTSLTVLNTEQVKQATEEIDKIVQKILDVQIEELEQPKRQKQVEEQEPKYELQETEAIQLPESLLTEIQAEIRTEIGAETTLVQKETLQKVHHLLLELTEEERTELKREVLKQERTYQQNVSEFVGRYETELETETVHTETILDQIRILCLEELFGKEVKKENSREENNRPILLEEELLQPEITYKASQMAWNTKQVEKATEEIDKIVQKILDVQIEEPKYESQGIEAVQLPESLLTEIQAEIKTEIGAETTLVQKETLQKVHHLLLELSEEERTELKREVLKKETTYQQNVSEFVERYETELETETVHTETILDQIRILCLEELFGKEVKKENSREENNRPILLEEELLQPEITYKVGQMAWNTKQVEKATEEIDKIVQKILDVQIEELEQPKRQKQVEEQEPKYELQETEAIQLPESLLTEIQAEIGAETTLVQKETLQKVHHLLLALSEEERTELKREVLKQERTYQQNVSEFVERYETELETETVHTETILDQIRILCLEELFGKEVKKENSREENNSLILLEEELPESEMTYKTSQMAWNTKQVEKATEEIDKIVQKILDVQIEELEQPKRQKQVEEQEAKYEFQRIEAVQLPESLLTEIQAEIKTEIGAETTLVQKETLQKVHHLLLELSEEERTELKKEVLKKEVLKKETTYQQNVSEFVERYETELETETVLNTEQVKQATEEIDKIVQRILDVQIEELVLEQPKRQEPKEQQESKYEFQETTLVQQETVQKIQKLLIQKMFKNSPKEAGYEQMQQPFLELTEKNESIQQFTAHPQIQELMEKRELQTPKETRQMDERLQYYRNHEEKVEKLREEQKQQFRMLQETTQQQAKQLVKIENWQQEIKERLLEQEQTQPLKNQDEKTLRKFQEQLRLERIRRGLI